MIQTAVILDRGHIAIARAAPKIKRDGVLVHLDVHMHEGHDVNSSKRAIEVETANTVQDGFRQLRGFRKPVYIAGADQEATRKAVEATKGTIVGVMDPKGKVVKPSTRKRK